MMCHSQGLKLCYITVTTKLPNVVYTHMLNMMAMCTKIIQNIIYAMASQSRSQPMAKSCLQMNIKVGNQCRIMSWHLLRRRFDPRPLLSPPSEVPSLAIFIVWILGVTIERKKQKQLSMPRLTKLSLQNAISFA